MPNTPKSKRPDELTEGPDPSPDHEVVEQIRDSLIERAAFGERVGVSESVARRAARRAGFVARKSRGKQSADNLGGFQLLDPKTKRPAVGLCFQLTAAEVYEFCRED